MVIERAANVQRITDSRVVWKVVCECNIHRRMSLKVYLAGPITGLTFEEATLDFITRANQLRTLGYEVLHPFTGKAHLRNHVGAFLPSGHDSISSDHAIIERDRWMVSQANIIYMNLSGAKRVSIGSMFELAWAHDRGAHTIVVMESDNIHQHAFVKEAADIMFSTTEEAFLYLESLINGTL